MTRHGLRVDVPVSWLMADWWNRLDLAERGAYVSALAYSMSQRLDGEVPREALRFIDADAAAVSRALDNAVELGRMERTADGWRFLDWTGMQEQSTTEQIDASRERNRRKQRDYRERQSSTALTGNATGHGTGDAGGNATGPVGKGRPEQSRPEKSSDRSASTHAPASDGWRTRVPGEDRWTQAAVSS